MAKARVQSVPHKQRSNPQASNTRASGSQMSGNGYGSRASVQAPLTLITAFGRCASASTCGRSAQGCGGAGGTLGCTRPRWSTTNRVSGWRSISAVPASRFPEHRILTGKSWLAAARQMRSSPDRKSTRLNSSHVKISYAVFCLKKKKKKNKIKNNKKKKKKKHKKN